MSVDKAVYTSLVDQVEHAEDLLRGLQLHQNDNKLCDIVLIAGKDGQRISGHRIILASSSPYFSAMFTGTMMEATQPEVTLAEVKGKYLLPLIQHCYTGKLEITEANVVGFIATASLLQLHLVVAKCSKFLEEQLHPSNCLGVASLAEMYNCDSLLRRANEVIAEQYDVLVLTEEFNELSAECLAKLLPRSELVVRQEEQILMSVVGWMLKDKAERSKHFPMLLERVRLPLVPRFVLLDVKSMLQESGHHELLEEAIKWHGTPEDVRVPLRPLSQQYKQRKGQDGLLALFCRYDQNQDDICIEHYCPNRDKWTPFTVVNSKRQEYAAAIFNDQLIIAGGAGLSCSKVYQTVLSLDLATQNIKKITPLLTARLGLGLAVVEGSLLAVGGNNGRYALSSVERYDATTETWSYVAPMAVARSSMAITTMSGRLYAVGGCDGTQSRSVTEVYDPLKDIWITCDSMIYPRKNFGVAARNGFLYAMGGVAYGSASTIERYDPKTDEWIHIMSMTTGPTKIACLFLGERLISIMNKFIGGLEMAITVEEVDINSHAIMPRSERLESEQLEKLHLACVVEVPHQK